MELDDHRRTSLSSMEEMRLESPSPFRAVPKGSDVFQKAMVQLYSDMQAEKEKKRLRREKAGVLDEEEDYSDEERDKCTDIKKFRRFSQDFSAKQYHYRRTASLHYVPTSNAQTTLGTSPPSPRLTHLGTSPPSQKLTNLGTSPPSPRLPKLSEIQTFTDKKQSSVLRRHSIAIIPHMDSKSNV